MVVSPGTWWGKARDAGKPLTMYKTAPPSQQRPTRSQMASAELEKPWSKVYLSAIFSPLITC